MAPIIQDLGYNGSYMGGEAILTVILLLIPAVREGLSQVKSMAKNG